MTIAATRLRSASAAAEARASGTAQVADRPRNRRSSADASSPARVRAQMHRINVRAAADGSDIGFTGYASVTETAYEMWDFWGPYSETIAAGAFGPTLAREPDVAFLLNHGGMTLARTTSGTLRLSEDSDGLLTDADLDPRNSVVGDIASGLRRGDLDEMSFAFRLTRGSWDPSYTAYRVEEIDIDRGDVSVVNFGANPGTSAALRSAQILDGLAALDVDELARAEIAIAARRSQLAGPGSGMSAAELDAICRAAQPHPAAAGYTI